MLSSARRQRLGRRRPRLPRGNRNRAVHVAKDRRNLRTTFRPRVALALLFVARLQGGEGDDPVQGPDEANRRRDAA